MFLKGARAIWAFLYCRPLGRGWVGRLPCLSPGEQINIGRLPPAFAVTPPDMRVHIRRFGGLSYRPPLLRVDQNRFGACANTDTAIPSCGPRSRRVAAGAVGRIAA
jgi:hypothetical protein